METVIEVKNLSKVFYGKKVNGESKEIWALNDISFQVNKGEIFGLLGPNGAGKTTTIRCISGLLNPTAGAIYVKNENMKYKSSILRKSMGFLTENHGNYESLTVSDNLSFFGSFYELNNLNERIEGVLKELGLFQRKDMKAGKLSKGQKQRLAIARAILHNPEIIFFDEPTAGLDPVAAVNLRDLIKNLKRKDRTIFINTHNLEEAQKLCSRVAILDEGKIKRMGSPSDLSKELWELQEMVCTLKSNIIPQIEDVLKDIPMVSNYTIEDNRIHFYSTDVNESTPVIVKELVKHGADILEVKRKVHSLEDIYLKLMDNQEIEGS